MGTPIFEPGKHSVRRGTAHAVIQAMNKWTVESLMSFRSPGCVNITRPHSLNVPSLTNEGYAAYIKPQLSAFRNFHCRIHDVLEDDEANAVVMRTSSIADTDVGPYNSESIISLQFNEDGDQVVVFTEFFDSIVSKELLAKLKIGAGNNGNST